MNELGRLEDLPQDYRDDLTKLNLVPLWPSLRAVLPPGVPTRATQATHWPYATLKPLLLKAGELTPIEKAERRVLVLANPGHGLENMKASPAIYLGMQLLLPGEWAPSHRHTPNAVRMIVEGEGAYTTVDGEKCPMSRGDLILTPTGLWHEHGHDGTESTARARPSNRAAATVPGPAPAWCPRKCSAAATSATPCCATPGWTRVPRWCPWPKTSRTSTACRSPT